jgi:selT/selW/selH-like putative selenoprotein
MRRTFLQAKKFLQDEFPLQVEVTGGNQPIEPIIQLLLNIISLLQLLTLACAIFGDKVFLGRDPPLLYFKLKQYAFMWMAAIFWIVPSILNKWIITGAFEVTVDGTLIFSKLEQGRLPTAADLTGPLIEMGLKQKGTE